MTKLLLYTDGGSRGNPGPGAIGIVICKEEGNIICQTGKYIGETTNNRAEYTALIKGLEKCIEFSKEEVECFSDSQLMIKQLKGEYKVKNKQIIPLFLKVKEMEKNFKNVNYNHVERYHDKIRIADMLVNSALDKQINFSLMKSKKISQKV